MSETDKKIMKILVNLIAELLSAAQKHPKIGRKYNLARKLIETAMKRIGGGQPMVLNRPESIGLPVHTLKDEPEPTKYEPESDFSADNLDKE
jgi:hypothetical protein